MQCAFIVQNNEYCLKWKRWKLKERKQTIWKQFFNSAFILCPVFNDTNENLKIKGYVSNQESTKV